ncbi:MAG: hypothetical protein WDZ77_01730 [Candidatus Pacearchaeota archaeon]
MEPEIKNTLEKMLERAEEENSIISVCKPSEEIGGIKVPTENGDYWFNKGEDKEMYDLLISTYSKKISHGICPTHFQELYGFLKN